MGGFSPEYRAAIEETLRNFVKEGDDVACIGYFARQGGQCRMCGKQPITWHYVLENLNTHQWLVTGNECVKNYQIILAEWGWRPDYVVFPEFLRCVTPWILEENPNAVVFNDGVVMRYQVDCREVIDRAREAGRIEHSLHATRRVMGGEERLVGINQDGRCLLGGLPRAASSGPDPEMREEEYDPEEASWTFCGCEVATYYCEDCDNEVCPECHRGCTCGL
jgi:hypothetical protein